MKSNKKLKIRFSILQDECTHKTKCQIGIIANTSDEEYIRNSFTSTLYLRRYYVGSYTEGIDLLSKRVITHLLMDHSMARYYITRHVFKSLRISGYRFGSFGLSLAFSKFESNLKSNITKILLSYMDTGLQRFISKKKNYLLVLLSRNHSTFS